MSYKKNSREIEFEEIFLDAKNAPGYHRENLEGSIENPIKSGIFVTLGIFFFIVAGLFSGRLAYLQVVKGEALRERSEKNYIKISKLEAERGIIYDRNGEELLGNALDNAGNWRRNYLETGFLHLVGFTSRANKSADDPKQLEGVAGLEATYDELLRGIGTRAIEEVDAKGQVVSFGIAEPGREGKNLLTSIDKNLQIKLTEIIRTSAETYGFTGGVGIVMDVTNGEIIAMTSVPEFDPNILISGEKNSPQAVASLVNDPKKPFLNRAVGGLYPPGSIVKPAVALGALAEKIISPGKKILSTGSISIPNPYFPDQPTIFRDWKAHGWVDMRMAIAVSSDVYFYEVGGGYGDQQGLGANNLKKYFSLFGFGERAGIDTVGEKEGYVPDQQNNKNKKAWNIGDTYHLAIGQGDFLVTPMQVAVYTAAIASRGILEYPHLVKAIVDKNKEIEERFDYTPKRADIRDAILPDFFTIIHEAMRGSATYGTASGLGGFPISIAAKTGTAEIGDTGRVHSWSIGFFPYERPRLAFTILMENGSAANLVGGTYVASQMIQWMLQSDFLAKLDNGIIIK